nr:cation-translocating P-type ATPase [Alsobacter ponti]
MSEAEAARRLRRDGFNELPRGGARTTLRIAADVLREPMLALLFCGAAAYLLLGDLGEAVLMAALAVVSVGITVVQEARTERVLEALRDLTSPRALVVRDGVRTRIAGREVARGDVLVLTEGDRVAADAVLIEARDLAVDESLLTGESVPVDKEGPAPGAVAGSGGGRAASVFAGTLVTRGSGVAEVTATGPRTEIGKIGQSLATIGTESPRLTAQTRRVVTAFAVLGAGVAVSVVLLSAAFRGGWLDAILAGIAVAMAMMPEEFPVVIAVFLAMGAWRISQARVLTRRAAAIETLGSATVLCTDKTGTLTENRMRVAELRLADGIGREPPTGDEASDARLGELVRTGALASAPEPSDPMERAIHDAAGPPRDPAPRLVKSYPLRPDLLAMTQAWRLAEDRPVLLAAKGAPEAIFGLCLLDAHALSTLSEAVEDMGARGLRVLAVARATCADGDLPDSQDAVGFALLGLVGLADPLRPSVPAAVRECRAAGIRVVMITGDYPATARAIAGQAGIPAAAIVTGDELETLSDADLAARLREATIFARIMPRQKLRIVEALKASGEVVAMTGDGVNDAPSLKAAHIGIAMGGRGSDVAREASSIVLLDDDFSSIAKAVRLGRRIYDNLRKAMAFIVAIHIPIAGLALLPLLAGLPVILGPVHIAMLEMVIDPVCTLVFEAEEEEDGIMRRPPRPPDAPLFSSGLVAWGGLQGVAALGLVATMLFGGARADMAVDELRAFVFCTLMAAVLGLVVVNRSFSPSLAIVTRINRPLVGVVTALFGFLALGLWWQPARELLKFGPLHVADLAMIVAGAATLVVVLELVKALARARSLSP